ncbi:MAG: YidC/Oxa1 family membrane protein insertase [Clostridia bacterium]|nr:YidC/Oxa1 family membrane protein insertase [Clostridia bacterium]
MTAFITAPFAWLLMAFYNFTQNYGLAIILFAVALKLILLYPMMRSKHSMMRSARLQPYMKELEKRHEGNKAKYQEEVSKLYKEEKINPMSGCLWSMIPMIILFMLYSVIRNPFTTMMGISSEQFDTIKTTITSLGGTIPTGGYAQLQMASFVHEHFADFASISDKLVNLDFGFLGMNLGDTPSFKFFLEVDWSQTSSWAPALGLFLIPLVSGALSFFSMKVSNAANPTAAQQQGQMKMMMYMMPFVSVYIGFVMPAALGIYWIANSVLAIIQDAILNSYYGKMLDKEDAERRERLRARETELEKKRLETERLKALGATEINKNTSKKKIQASAKAQSNERLAAERSEEKAARRAALGLSNETPDSQVGNRRYARGRAYVEDRYVNPEGAEEATAAAAAVSAVDEAVDSEYAQDTGNDNIDTGNDA